MDISPEDPPAHLVPSPVIVTSICVLLGDFLQNPDVWNPGEVDEDIHK